MRLFDFSWPIKAGLSSRYSAAVPTRQFGGICNGKKMNAISRQDLSHMTVSIVQQVIKVTKQVVSLHKEVRICRDP